MDDGERISRIKNNGNKPEEWLDFLRKAKRTSKSYDYIVGLYEKAASSISPDDNRKNICYARLLVEFAKLQGMVNAEDARETFRCARCNVKRIAIVYIAWAQFELDKGNREKCRNHLLKGKTNRAEPLDVLELALKSCEQGNERLLDDETEELIFTGVVTKPQQRPAIPLPTVLSDNETTTDKLLVDDNTADVPQSKSDTDVISFKLPPSVNEIESKQRQKLSSSSSSNEDTVTAPFHHIVKPNRSMSTVKPSLKATPDSRTVGSKSISNSMNLSVRKPSRCTGMAKSFGFGALMGPPVRGRPVPLEEEKESQGHDLMAGIKPIDHTINITPNNTNEVPLNKQYINNSNHVKVEGKIEESTVGSSLNDQLLVGSSSTITAVTDSSTSHGNSTFPLSLNNEQYSHLNPEQGSNNIHVEKQPAVKHYNGTHEKNWLSHVDNNINSLPTNYPENSASAQEIVTPKLHGYSAAIHGQLLEPVKPVDQVSPVVSSLAGLSVQDGRNASNNSLTGGIQHSSLSGAIQPNPLSSGIQTNSVCSRGQHNSVRSGVQHNSSTRSVQPNPSTVQPNSLTRGIQHNSLTSGVQQKSLHCGIQPNSGLTSRERQHLELTPTENPIITCIPGNTNQFHPPLPQSGARYPNIVVNGKSYLKLGAIGRGGSSKVFRAFDGKRVCAIKYVSLEDADDFIIQSYINEIDMLKRLQGSDHIIKLYDWEQKKDENSIILVLECGSIDLAAFLRKNRSTFTETELIPYWKQMLEAVNVIHNQGIIHSDLKPANFLFVEGRLKLIDFGIANSIQADQTSIQRDTQVGTLNFMSPEAFQDISAPSQMNMGRSRPCTKIGRPSDVWSLGCILYAMVYGRTPFQHITNQAMKLQCIIDENYAIQFPAIGNPKLLDVLKGCLIRNPRERYTIPQLLEHPFLCKPDEAKEPDQEMFFDALVELHGANFSPSSFRVATKNIFEQLRSGNKIDVSSIVAKRNHQALHGTSRPGRQPLSGLTIDALQAQGHGPMKSSTPYMANDRPYLDKENADIMFTG